MLLFLVNPCIVVAVQPCMEWIPIKKTLLHRSFTILSDFSKFHFEVETLKKTLHKNAYPRKFADKCISKFVINVFAQKPFFTTILKLELRIVSPYLGNLSSITKKRLNRCISKHLKFCQLKSFFKPVTDSRIILNLKIVFLKPYNLTSHSFVPPKIRGGFLFSQRKHTNNNNLVICSNYS